MSALHITTLTITRFKHITTPQSWTFGAQVTLIRGDNGTGKSTLADAILWALFGRTPSGSKIPDAWIPQSLSSLDTMDPSEPSAPSETPETPEKETASSMALHVAIDFVGLDGKAHHISRKKADRTLLHLDGRPATDAQCAPLIGDFEQFLSVFSPLWLLQQSAARAREFCLSLLPTVNPADVRLMMGEAAQPLESWPQEWFDDVNATLKDLRAQKKQTEAEHLRLEGSLNAWAERSTDPPTPIEVPDDTAVRQASAALAVLQQDIPVAEGLQDLALFYRAVSDCQQALEHPQLPPDWEDPTALQAELTQLLQQQRALSEPLPPSEEAIAAQTLAIAHYAQQAPEPPLDLALQEPWVSQARQGDQQLAQWLAHKPPDPATASHATCPTCGQPLSLAQQQARQADLHAQSAQWQEEGQRLDQARQQWAHQLAETQRQAHDTYRQRQLMHEAELRRMRHALETAQAAWDQAHALWREQHDQWHTDRDTIQRRLDAVQSALQSLTARNADRQAQLSPRMAQDALIAAQERLTQAEQHNQQQTALAEALHRSRQAQAQKRWQEAQSAYATQQAAWTAYQQQHAQWQADLDQQQTWQALYQETQDALAHLTAQIAAGVQYSKTYVTLQVAPLQALLSDTTIQLFTVRKTTGEVEPTFQLRYRQVPVESIAYSERLLCGLELASAFITLRDQAVPCFVDNVESLLKNRPVLPTQMFWAMAVPKVPLTVQAAESADVTIAS